MQNLLFLQGMAVNKPPQTTHCFYLPNRPIKASKKWSINLLFIIFYALIFITSKHHIIIGNMKSFHVEL